MKNCQKSPGKSGDLEPLQPITETLCTGGTWLVLGTEGLGFCWACRFHVVCLIFVRIR